jgi:hypothetical protein
MHGCWPRQGNKTLSRRFPQNSDFRRSHARRFVENQVRALILALFVTTPAVAAPLLAPLRDVTVTYQVRPRDFSPLIVRVAIAAGGQRLRITAENLPTAFLVDRRAQQALVLLPMLKMYSEMRLKDADPETTVLRHAHFERHGQERIAGLACTDWTAISPDGRAAGCITDDGVILRGRATNHHGEIGTLQASNVEYGTVPADLFAVPSGYTNAGALPLGSLGLKQ